jgi:hypothetical protein
MAPTSPHEGELSFLKNDLSPIVHDVKGSNKFRHGKELEGTLKRLKQQLQRRGYEAFDETSVFVGMQNPLQLGIEWAKLVRRARTSNEYILVRRTLATNAPLLTQQRIEAFRGSCSDTSPVSMFVLARDKQLALLQDDIHTQDDIDRLLLELANEPYEKESDNMSQSLFDACQHSVEVLIDELQLS